ncbi:molybdopterin-dependent oxidoreductase [Granulicella sp. 5B5]|uniref:xanthine dehydrogenase family protein molybdopterin-binding subunit n=1 Tax=Granulicella sp. 5B5 TaxID=1617967 RepID=UPI0015F48A8D|nr:xanthine dehydrogenase family protein molybdopterin-binding subunit [Granulicella sp. 5B5]QMV18290.1 molybdopterin-dependent oxidoreductase [Granulicella sp. 5B5]
MTEQKPILGTSPLRKEGRAKVLGAARYIDDQSLPGMWHGATVRSTIARGRIRSITFDPAIDCSQYAIVRASDIPGANTIVHIIQDHPCLADPLINHPYEPILLLAHPEKAALLTALAAIHIDYDELPGVFTIEDSESAVAANDTTRIIWDRPDNGGSANCFKQYTMHSGDADEVEAGLAAAFEHADFIVEGEYATGAQEQLYIEPNGVIAECFFKPTGEVESVTVRGSLQCPYYLVHALSVVFNLPQENCRVIQVETGGAFGGKEDFPSVIGSHAALLAMKSGHPVKMIYDRAEDMASTTKRHPSRTRHRTAVSKDGKLLAGTIEVALDGGAYATLSSTVLSRATIHAPGPYKWPYLRVNAKAMATNIPPHGAFRGFGAPQSLFALERHMDRIAHTIGISPEELRRKNFLGTGDKTATGQPLLDPVDMQHLLTRALAESNYHAKLAEFAKTNPTSPIKRGIGFAAFMHGTGFTGSGERRLNSLVHLDLTPDGRPQILVSSTEFGQGTNTILCQVAAQNLQLPYDDILIHEADTAFVPNSGPTVASRTAMIVGKLVERTSQQLLNTLRTHEHLPTPHTREDFYRAARCYLLKHGSLRESARYEPPAPIFWDDDKYRGDAYPGYAWAVYVAEVAVDTRTYMATCTRFDALQEVGKVMHPVLAKGQIEGGVAQGIGYALYEKCVWNNGKMMNNQMTNYIMPTSADLPEIHVHFEEVPSIHGPGGAKGIGELPMDGPAPAILNAIENALGIPFNTIPLLPEDIFERLTSTHANGEVLNPTVDLDTKTEVPA